MSGIPCAHCLGTHPTIADVIRCGETKRDQLKEATK